MNLQSNDTRKPQILIVDDQPDNISILSILLEDSGYEVEGIIDGQQALTFCQNKPPDLILMDIMMPRLNGYEVCSLLKSSAQTCDIPIIFLSALNDVNDKIKAFEVGGVDYITKPFKSSEILARLSTHLKIYNFQKELQAKNQLLEEEIRERNRVQQELTTSEKELNFLLDSLKQLILILDSHGEIIRVAGSVQEILEQGDMQTKKKFSVDFLTQEQIDLFLQSVQQSLEQKKAIDYEFSLIIKGETKWLCCSISPMSEHTVITIVRDITASKEAEIALRLEEEKFRAAFQSSPNLIGIYQFKDGLCLDVNNTFLEVTGYTRYEVVGKFSHAQEFVENIDQGAEFKKTLEETGRIDNYEVNFNTKYGEERTGLLSAQFIYIQGEGCILTTINDITDRKNLEDKFWQTQRFLESIVENLPLALFTKDIQNDFRFVLWNKTAEEIFGLSREEVLNHNDYDFFPKTQAEFFRSKDLELLEKQQLIDIPEEPVDSHSLGRIYLRTIKLPIFNDRGEITHLLCISENITARKEAEAKMRLLERAIATSSNGIFISDPHQGDNPIIYVNPAFEILTGYTAEDAIGKNGRFLHRGDNDQTELKTLEKAFLEEKECCVVMRNYRQDGTLFWDQLSLSPVRDNSGKLTNFIGFMTDVSARQRAEQALQESEELFRLLVNQSPVGIYQTNAGGDYLFVNPYWLELTEISPLDSLGEGWSKALHPEDMEWVLSEWLKVTQMGIEFNIEFRFITPQGKINWVYSRAVPIKKQGIITGYFGTVVDINTRKRAEQALHKEIRRAMLLGQITQEIRSSLDSHQMFQTAVTQIGITFNVTRCLLHTYINASPPKIPLVAEYLESTYQSFFPREVPVVNNPHLALILAQEDAVSSPNVYDDPLLQFADELLHEYQIKSMLVVRTSYRGETNGIICLHQCDRFRQWTEEEIDLIEAVALQVGIALAQANFIDQEQQRLWELDQQNIQLQEALQERQRIDQLLQGHNQILEMIAKGLPLKEVLEVLVHFIESRSQNALCGFALFDPSNNTLCAGVSPSLPNDYTRALDGMKIGPLAGSCGTAAFYKQTIVASDITTDPRWTDFRDFALSYGLRACWSTPILSVEGDVLATFAMYYKEIHTPTIEEQELINKAVYLAKVAIERQRSEENYRTIFESSYDGIVVFNPETGSILDANEKFCQIFGLSRIAISEISFNQLSLAEYPYTEIEFYQRIKEAKTGEIQRFEWRSKEHSGHVFWSEIILKRTGLGGKERILGIVRDIRDRKQAEEQLQQAAEAAQIANKTKSLFLANMSHELRTPLNAILGFTQVMSRHSDITPEQREYLNIINRSGEHLLELINDVLSMSKIEAGQVSFSANFFDLYQLFNDLESMLKTKANRSGLKLTIEREKNLPQYIKTDEKKLRQVLINLLGNAIKFTEKGSVTLRVKRKRDEMRAKEDIPAQNLLSSSLFLQFEIEDTGMGISPVEVEALFKPFLQTESGRKSLEGTGLGLAISREFVKLMGGDITVFSEVGKGSIFSFEIEATLSQSDEIIPKHPLTRVIGLAPNQPSYRILIVEDKVENRKLLVQLLKPLGFEVREAVNGLEGITVWQNWHPHLIWMDMRMPVMDGCEATRRIKSTPEGQNTVIIALTASAFEEDRINVLNAGCNDFVGKPFREEFFFEKIAEYLGVRYIYEDSDHGNLPRITTTEESNSEDLIAALATMPIDWVRELQQAAICCDDEKIFRLLENIPPSLNELTHYLTDLVGNFYFDKITELTQSIIP
jgi:PAS domain S-box-containing protein